MWQWQTWQWKIFTSFQFKKNVCVYFFLFILLLWKILFRSPRNSNSFCIDTTDNIDCLDSISDSALSWQHIFNILKHSEIEMIDKISSSWLCLDTFKAVV